MDYVSTRNKERKVSAAYAIANGIANSLGGKIRLDNRMADGQVVGLKAEASFPSA